MSSITVSKDTMSVLVRSAYVQPLTMVQYALTVIVRVLCVCVCVCGVCVCVLDCKLPPVNGDRRHCQVSMYVCAYVC